MTRAERVYETISNWNDEGKTEKEIVDRLAYELSNWDKNDVDLLYAFNDALSWHGYSYKFKEPEYEGDNFNPDEYHSLLTNVKKSKEKTRELLIYLHCGDSFIISTNTLSFIKIEHLINLDSVDAKLEGPYKNYNLYDLYMMSLAPRYDDFFNGNRELVKKDLEKFLDMIGIYNLQFLEMQFRLDMEYLLWTITKSLKSSDAFMKINTIKVGLQITPRKFFIWGDKKYFNENIHKNLVKYLSYIDKTEATRIYEKYKNKMNDLYDTGYKLLFNML